MQVRWTSAALRRRAAIIEYIAQDNPEAALQLDADIAMAARKLLQFPMMGRCGRLPGTREWLVRKNYLLVYLPDAMGITVLGVMHVAQDFWHESQ